MIDSANKSDKPGKDALLSSAAICSSGAVRPDSSIGQNQIPQGAPNSLANWIDRQTRQGGVDFHLHSTCSDGSETPDRLAEQLLASHVRFFSMTDHDTVSAYRRLHCHGSQILPGVELTVDFEDQEIHCLGYFPSVDAALKIDSFLAEMKRSRARRNEQLLEKLRLQGWEPDLDQPPFQGISLDQISRVHVAQWLCQKRVVFSTQEAFDIWLNEGQPLYVPRERPTLSAALKAIHQAGGVAFLAHPQEYGWLDSLATAPKACRRFLSGKLERAQDLGLDGVEAFHGRATKKEQALIYQVACSLQLPVSAGSDWHGANRPSQKHYDGQVQFVDSLSELG